MAFREFILIAVVFLLSTFVWTIFKRWRSSENGRKSAEIKNVYIDIELQKRKVRDEVDSAPLDDLIKRRNDSGEGS